LKIQKEIKIFLETLLKYKNKYIITNNGGIASYQTFFTIMCGSKNLLLDIVNCKLRRMKKKKKGDQYTMPEEPKTT